MREDLDIDPDTGGVSYACIRARREYLGHCMDAISGAALRAGSASCRLMWLRHLEDLRGRIDPC